VFPRGFWLPRVPAAGGAAGSGRGLRAFPGAELQPPSLRESGNNDGARSTPAQTRRGVRFSSRWLWV